MQNRAVSLYSAFRQEPGQLKWLLRFGLAGPLVITIWAWAGEYVVDSLVVSLVQLLLMLVYGAVLAVLVVRLMYASGAWQTDASPSVDRLRRRLDEPVVAADETTRAAVSHPSHFHEVHFLLRLQEEVAKARRDGDELSVVWLEVTLPGEDSSGARAERMAVEVAQLLASQAKTIGQSLNLEGDEYVFSLPHHGRSSARAFVSKTVQALGNYWCHCGIAAYPNDGTDAESLFGRARELCDESREDGKPASQALRRAL